MSEVYREYEPHAWVRHEPITADKLNNIEEGIDAIDNWVQGTSASAVSFANGRNIGTVTVNGTTANLQVPPSTHTAISVNQELANGLSIGVLTIDGVETELKVPPPDTEVPLIIHDMGAEDTNVTILALPNTYVWDKDAKLSSLTIHLSDPMPEKEYHFAFSTAENVQAEIILDNKITDVIGTIRSGRRYEIDIWNYVAVILDCTETPPVEEIGNTKSLIFTNVNLATSAWHAFTDTESSYYTAGYRYYADIPAQGASGDYIPFVNFDVATVLSGNMAPVAECPTASSNIVRIWAIAQPSSAMTIPSVVCISNAMVANVTTPTQG